MAAVPFSPALIIKKKRDGEALTAKEIDEFIRGITDGSVADYQASAFLMAVFFQGMDLTETVALTRAMLDSGERYGLSDIKGVKVDKHSTGGIGDKISIPLAPILADCGMAVPMISGRGLGTTGGTIDKLESIPGWRAALPNEEMLRQLEDEIGQPLLIREGRQLRLTDVGRILFERGQDAIGVVRQLAQEVTDLTALARGELTVGMPPMVNLFFSPVVKAFRERHPGVRLTLLESGGQTIEQQVASGELEVGADAADCRADACRAGG